MKRDLATIDGIRRALTDGQFQGLADVPPELEWFANINNAKTLRAYKANDLQPSMSRRGNCWYNAVAESFFGSLKKEPIKKRIYRTRDLARADIFEYIEMFYNPNRRHSHLGGVSPEAFERASF